METFDAEEEKINTKEYNHNIKQIEN